MTDCHGDMIGSMRMRTDGSSGSTVAQGRYTAFGGESRWDRDERERAAIGKASEDARGRPATCPDGVSRRRTTGGFISGERERYGYAGAWGYQTDTGVARYTGIMFALVRPSHHILSTPLSHCPSGCTRT